MAGSFIVPTRIVKVETSPNSTNSVLTELREDVQRLHRKFDKYVVGESGGEGLMDRMTRIEERHNFLRTALAWMAAAFVAACFFFVPESHHK